MFAASRRVRPRRPLRRGSGRSLRRVLYALFAFAATAPAFAECVSVDGAPSSLRDALAHLEPDPIATSGVPVPPAAATLATILDRGPGAAPPSEDASARAARAMAEVYDRPWPPPALEGDALPSPDQVEAWLAGIGDDLVTQAILTTDGTDRRRATFAAVHWPSPLAPRLRVVRIPDELRGRENREEVLALLGTCAVDVDEWMSAPEEVALRFLEDHVHAAMLIAGRDTRTGETVERWIEPENLIPALRFEDPRTANLDSFSAWFAGEVPPPLAVTRLLPHLRSSLGPGDLLSLYRSFGATSGGR